MSWSYELPDDRIAQRPVSYKGERSSSRLLVVRRDGEPQIESTYFNHLPAFLRASDLLILNDSAVARTRYFVNLPPGAPATEFPEIEVFIVSVISVDTDRNLADVTALARPMKKLKEGMQFALSENLTATVLGRTLNNDELRLKVTCDRDAGEIRSLLFSEGEIPIPSYIRKGRPDSSDETLYQTVYASEKGSVAAPTAGLHFTTELLSDLEKLGVRIAFLTHHVGRASFMAVRPAAGNEKPASVPEERFFIPAESIRAIEAAKREGRRIVVVGTTSTRALESFARNIGANGPGGFAGSTDLFIEPGFEFKIVDALITNFHQPNTTHISLVSAFAGEELVSSAYEFALGSNFRFLSYGDSMIILGEQ